MKLFNALKKARQGASLFLRHCRTLLLAWIFRRIGYRSLAQATYRLLRLLPEAWLGGQYRLCKQNLALLPLTEQQRHLGAIRYLIIHQIRIAMKVAYSWMSCAERERTLAAMQLEDPQQLLAHYCRHSAIAVMFHSGDYWLNIIFILSQLDEPTDIVFIRANQHDLREEQSIRSLVGFGHRIHFYSTEDTAATIRLYKSLRMGYRALVFVDLPPDLGGKHYGVPRRHQLFGKPAYFVQGISFLAARTGRDLLLLSSRLDEQFNNHLHLLKWVAASDEQNMFDQVVDEMNLFLTQYAESWYFLPYIESYFHYRRE